MKRSSVRLLESGGWLDELGAELDNAIDDGIVRFDAEVVWHDVARNLLPTSLSSRDTLLSNCNRKTANYKRSQLTILEALCKDAELTMQSKPDADKKRGDVVVSGRHPPEAVGTRLRFADGIEKMHAKIRELDSTTASNGYAANAFRFVVWWAARKLFEMGFDSPWWQLVEFRNLGSGDGSERDEAAAQWFAQKGVPVADRTVPALWKSKSGALPPPFPRPPRTPPRTPPPRTPRLSPSLKRKRAATPTKTAPPAAPRAPRLALPPSTPTFLYVAVATFRLPEGWTAPPDALVLTKVGCTSDPKQRMSELDQASYDHLLFWSLEVGPRALKIEKAFHRAHRAQSRRRIESKATPLHPSKTEYYFPGDVSKEAAVRRLKRLLERDASKVNSI
jgi:hypothetical protein